ncbi:hypothetical protein Tco_1037534 [Tanacetum coccineum]
MLSRITMLIADIEDDIMDPDQLDKLARLSEEGSRQTRDYCFNYHVIMIGRFNIQFLVIISESFGLDIVMSNAYHPETDTEEREDIQTLDQEYDVRTESRLEFKVRERVMSSHAVKRIYSLIDMLLFVEEAVESWNGRSND